MSRTAALNVDGKIFHSTGYKTQESAEKIAANVNGEVRPYGVEIKSTDPVGGGDFLVTKWEKAPGFSVWI